MVDPADWRIGNDGMGIMEKISRAQCLIALCRN
jgi:hypothetical protein